VKVYADLVQCQVSLERPTAPRRGLGPQIALVPGSLNAASATSRRRGRTDVLKIVDWHMAGERHRSADHVSSKWPKSMRI
jgi:hypothetical protein